MSGPSAKPIRWILWMLGVLVLFVALAAVTYDLWSPSIELSPGTSTTTEPTSTRLPNISGLFFTFGPNYAITPQSLGITTAASENGATTTTAQLYKDTLYSPNVDGVYIRTLWKTVEPTPGHYNWQYLDSQLSAITAAGKKATISVAAGVDTPQWVYDEAIADGDGKASIEFPITFEQATLPNACSKGYIPIPWNSVYLSEFGKMVQAFGAHYAHNPTVVGVKITGINYDTDETILPRGTGGVAITPVNPSIAPCMAPNDVADWQSAGYTSTKAEQAFSVIVQDFGAAFPNQYLIEMSGNNPYAVSPGSFPPIGPDGKILQSADTIGTREFFAIAYNALGKRFIAQNNSLTDTNVDPDLLSWAAEKHPLGFQFGFPISGDATDDASKTRALICYENGYHKPCYEVAELQSILSQVLGHATYIEEFPADILNPALNSLVTEAHQKLLVQ